MAPVLKPPVNKALAVGLLVAVTGAAFLFAYTFFRKGGYSERESYQVHAFFDDATGISWKSRVQIAGIQVGEVRAVSLEGSRARLDLRIRNEIDLRRDACVVKRFPSALLPDAELELSRGTGSSPPLRDLPEAEREITCVREAASVARLLDSLSKVTADIQVITSDLTQTVAGTRGSIREVIENLSSISRSLEREVSDSGDKIGAILDNAEAFSWELRSLTETDRDRYHAIARNVEQASAQLTRVLESVQEILGTHKPELRESFEGLQQAMDKLNSSLSRIEQMTERVAEGKGVAGKLLADEKMGEDLGKAIEGFSSYANRLIQLQVQMDIRSEWLLNETGSKTYFGVRILPRPDKFYLVEVVSDPRGVNTVTNETVTTVNPATGERVSTVATRTVNERKLTFSAQIGKRYDFVTLRIGMIENSGGVGADLHLLGDHLQLTLNLYQFTRPTQDVWPRAKLYANYNFLGHFYVTVGSDDFLNAWRSGRYPGGPRFSIGRDVFFGAGLYFTDDDIKTLIGSIGGSASTVTR